MSETCSCSIFHFSLEDSLQTWDHSEADTVGSGARLSSFRSVGGPWLVTWPPEDSTELHLVPLLLPAATPVSQLFWRDNVPSHPWPFAYAALSPNTSRAPTLWGLFYYSLTDQFTRQHGRSMKKERFRPKAGGLEPLLCFQRVILMCLDLFLDFSITPSLITQTAFSEVFLCL